MLGKLKLGAKFTLLLTMVFLMTVVLSGVLLWSRILPEAEDEVTTKAQILFRTMNSVRDYTSENIRHRLGHHLDLDAGSEFIRETVPGFAAKEVFKRFSDRPEYKSFRYKEAALNPTNRKDDLVDEFEKELVERFQQQPNLPELSNYRVWEGERLFYTAKPLKVKEQSCLQCHGHPSAAPKSLIRTYGNKNGFGWHLNEVVAAQIIYVPSNEVFNHARQVWVLIMGIFSAIFTVAILLINRLLKQTVIHPVKQLTAIARHLSSGTMTGTQLQAFDAPNISQVAQRADEPGQLARAFQRLAREVAAREQNLFQAVEERTAQLAETMKEAEAAKAKAEAANSTKSQFLSHMSHELRTPLNVILGFAQLMNRQGSLNDRQQEYLDTISRSGEHLLTLINDVLEISKIEAGKIALNQHNFDLQALLRSLYQMLRLKAESKGLQLNFELSRDLPPYICTDEIKLRQVLLNLLGNAIKFTRSGTITLRASAGNFRVEEAANSADEQKSGPVFLVPTSLIFEVRDTGVGIAADELKNLFEPFVQAEAGRHSQEGTGLGLPISQEFVRLMGGEIAVKSQLGVGTTFTFSIAIQVVKAGAIPTPSARQVIGLEGGQPQYRILIVEDKPENRQFLRELLVPIGFEVREANNGREAIALHSSWWPHLIWMDLQMPIVDGYEATRQIRAREMGEEREEFLNSTISPPCKTAIVALSGSAFEEDRIKALSVGCDDFVRKPVRAETIWEKMAECLGVRYIYAQETEEKIAKQRENLPAQSLNSADLMVMPADWIEQLHQAALKVNAKEILQLIEQIPPSSDRLAQSLTHLVNNFGFKEIVTLTQSL
jgi:signal transduction histidine kinase/CheY-like chemotaxis protein